MPGDGGGPIDVIVDFLMPRDAEIVKNVPPLINEFAVQRASGADDPAIFDLVVRDCDRTVANGHFKPAHGRIVPDVAFHLLSVISQQS